MSQPSIVVELLDRSGCVAARHRCDKLPARLGRAYDNEIIVDDPFVAPTHVLIQRRPDGMLVARDMSTHNRIYEVQKEHRQLWRRAQHPSMEIVLMPETVVRMGHSTFRVRSSDQVVAPERRDTTAHSWEGTWPAGVALILITLVALFLAWMEDTNSQENLRYQTNVALILGIMVGWAATWTLLNRLLAGRARFGRHFLIGAICLAGTVALSLTAELIAYAFSLGWASRFSSYIGLSLLSIAVFFHVVTITPLSVALARRVALAFVLLAVGLFGMYQYSTEHQFGDSLYMTSLHWPAIRVTAPISTEEFVRATDNLTDRAEQRRSEGADSAE